MSQIHQVITTEFRAHGNQAVATMGSIEGGFRRIGQQINETTRMSERFGRQWQAIGTTIRYALAGSIIFGLRGVLSEMKEIQQQAGLISAIGSTQGGGLIVGKNLTNLMAQARQGAVESITPLQDFNNAMINFLSTVSGAPENAITPMVVEISKAAKLAQVNAEDATKAFTSMNTAFGQKANIGNVHRIAQEFFILTREAPGGVAAGQQIITQLGQLAAVTRAGHGTPEDIFSLALSGLRGGIPPAQLGRGLQYAIQTISLPGQQSKKSQAALRSVGIRPGVNLTVQQRLARLFGRARQLGGVSGKDIGKIMGIDEESLANFDALGEEGSAAALKGFGVSGKGAEFLGQAFPRIHALRAILAYQTQLDVGRAQKDLKEITDASKGMVSDVNDINKAWKRYDKQAQLQKATIAINSMGQQVAQIFAPVINFAAGHVTGFSELMARHAKGTQSATVGLVGVAGVLAMLKASGVPLGQALRGSRGKLFGVQAAAAALTGGGGQTVMGGLGNNPLNPMFVYVVNSLGPLSMFKGAGAAGTLEGAAAGLGRGGHPRLPGTGASFSSIVGADTAFLQASPRAAALMGAGALAGTAAVPLGIAMMTGFNPIDAEVRRRIFDMAQSDPEKASAFAKRHGIKIGANQIRTIMGKGHPHFFQGMFGGPGAAQHMEAFQNAQHPNDPVHIRRLFRTAFENINGKAYITMDVNLQHPGGKIERKRIVVPLNLWAGSRNPTTRGGKPPARNLP